MHIAELIPHLKQLSQTDKLQILHFLTSELLNDAGVAVAENSNETSISKGHNSFQAAAILTKALEEHQAKIHGR